MPQLYPDQSQTQSLSPTGQPVTQSPSPAPPKQQQDGLGSHDPIVTLTQSMLTMAQTIGTMAETICTMASPLEHSAKDLEARWAMNGVLRRHFETLSKDLDDKQQRLTVEQKELKDREGQAKQKSDDAEKKLQQAIETEAKSLEREKQLRPLQAVKEFADQTWPSCLRGVDYWEEWRRGLLDLAKDRPEAALLVVAFHRFCASERTGEDQELWDALRELGQRLYQFYQSQDDQNQNVISQIADALNSSSNGRFKLVPVKPGAFPDQQYMNYPQGMGINTVKEVRNWAIYKTSPGGTMQLVQKAVVK